MLGAPGRPCQTLAVRCYVAPWRIAPRSSACSRRSTRRTWSGSPALIRIPSFKTEETPVARFLAPFFRKRDYRGELQEVEPGRLYVGGPT